jgi:hypothetical protein
MQALGLNEKLCMQPKQPRGSSGRAMKIMYSQGEGDWYKLDYLQQEVMQGLSVDERRPGERNVSQKAVMSGLQRSACGANPRNHASSQGPYVDMKTDVKGMKMFRLNAQGIECVRGWLAKGF